MCDLKARLGFLVILHLPENVKCTPSTALDDFFRPPFRRWQVLRTAYEFSGPNQFRSLDPFDCREPGGCAVVVISRLNPVRFDAGDIPSIAGVERRSQLFLTDGVRASIGTIVTEAQHIQGSIVLGHRR